MAYVCSLVKLIWLESFKIQRHSIIWFIPLLSKIRVFFVVWPLFRESLAACRENLKSLCHQCTELQLRVTDLEQRKRGGEGEGRGGEGEGRGGEGEEEGRSVASCGFLRAHLGRVRGEIEREKEVEKELVDKLKVRNILKCKKIAIY